MVIKESSESGVSTIGFLTILAVISVSLISSVSFTIKDAEAKVDRSVEFDIKNMGGFVNNRIAAEDPSEEVLIDNAYIGTDDSGVPTSVNNPLSKGTIMTADGTPGGYCLFASNPAGNLTVDTRYVFASIDGGFHVLADGQFCKKGIIETLVSDQ